MIITVLLAASLVDAVDTPRTAAIDRPLAVTPPQFDTVPGTITSAQIERPLLLQIAPVDLPSSKIDEVLTSTR